MNFRGFAFSFLLCIAAAPSVTFGQALAPVVVAKAQVSQVTGSSTYVATINPSKRVVIGSAVSGRVEACLVEEGDRVEKNQPLVQVLTNTIELELKAKEAQLSLRKFELTEMENGFRTSEVAQAEARMLAAKASADLANSQLQRIVNLRQANAIPKDELDQAQSTLDQAQQNYIDLKSAFELVREGTRIEKIEQARALVAFEQAEVDRIKDQIKKYTVITRFNGYVTNQFVEPGAWVMTGAPVYEVIDLDEVELQALVPEQHVRFIHSGLEVPIVVPSIPNESFTGTVRTVIPQADLQARTFPVIVRVKNRINEFGPVLKSGLVARVELPTTQSDTAVMVPKDALVLGGKTPMVFVIQKDGSNVTVKPVSVQTGIAEGNMIQVTGDIMAGQSVVVEGNERLRPGQGVEVVNKGNGKDSRP